jgi:hypothetical protein
LKVFIRPNIGIADLGSLKDCIFLGLLFSFISLINFSLYCAYFSYLANFNSDGLIYDALLIDRQESSSGEERGLTKLCFSAFSCSANFFSLANSSSFYLFSVSFSFSLARILFYLF